MGIYQQSTLENAYACWAPYSINNDSQKWYIEAINYRPGDVNMDGIIDESDKALVQRYNLGLETFNNIQYFLADANRDNILNFADAVYIAQIISSN